MTSIVNWFYERDGNPENQRMGAWADMMDSIAASHDLKIESGYHDKEYINSYVRLVPQDVTLYTGAQLSQFPNNCGTLILSHIQGYDYLKAVTEASIEIAEALKYSSVIVSGTDSLMAQELMQSYGFEIIVDNLMNPHSFNTNFFLLKRIFA